MINYLIYRLGYFLVMAMPLKCSYLFADIVCTFHFFISSKDRVAVMSNLRAIFPKKPEKEIFFISWKMFRNFGRYLAVFFRSSIIDDKFIEKYVEFENMDYIGEMLKKYSGIIATTAHIGNWELAASATAFYGYPVVVVAMVHKNKRIDSFFNKQRRRTKVGVIPLGRAAKGCLEALTTGKVLALVGDRDFTRGGFRVDFFGKTAIIPKGPAVFSLKTNVPIIPGFLTVQPNGKFKMRFEKPILPVSTGNEEKDYIDLTKKFLVVLEDYIRRYPEQWFMFRQFWVDDENLHNNTHA